MMTDDHDTFEEIRQLMQRSEYLKAFDLVRHAVAHGSDHIGIRHRGVLAMARIGSVDRAMDLFRDWGLDRVDGDEDVVSLWGRLLKDKAQTQNPARMRALNLDAIEAYNRAFGLGEGFFPAINIATLWAFAGNKAQSQNWAQRADTLAAGDPGYYALATRAEAQILRGQFELARQFLTQARTAPGADIAALSTTRKQLSRILTLLDGPLDLVDPLRPHNVVHFCGHRMSRTPGAGRFPPEEADRVAGEIRAALDDCNAGHAYGSLAAGADILFAEAVLERGGELDILLPFQKDEFIEVSVRDMGEQWVARMEHCLDAANDVHFVTEDAYLGHDDLFNYATRMALGLARIRAQMLGADLMQIAVWDGEDPGPDQIAGTAHDVALGHELGLAQTLIPSRAGIKPSAAQINLPPPPPTQQRARRTMIFGDLKGFSKLTDRQLPFYINGVLGACADVFAKYPQIKFRNTWGDGLFLVFDDVLPAAACAFELQTVLSTLDYEGLGLPRDLGLRLGMHYGPVYEAEDPVLSCPNFFGFHVSRAARVEPIAPEGEVYATEPTAAALTLHSDAFQCDYVGRVPLAKDYGELPMYVLKKSTT